MLRLIVFWERLTGAWLCRLKVSLVRVAGVVRVRLMLTMGTAGSVSSAFLGWRHSSSCPATTQSNLREEGGGHHCGGLALLDDGGEPGELPVCHTVTL